MTLSGLSNRESSTIYLFVIFSFLRPLLGLVHPDLPLGRRLRVLDQVLLLLLLLLTLEVHYSIRCSESTITVQCSTI